MNVNSLVWVKNPEYRDPSADYLWLQSTISEKHLTTNLDSVALTVKIYGKDHHIKLPKGAVESDNIKPRDNELNVETEDIQYLKHINEPEVIQLLRLRYENGLIFTYSGGVLMYLNPFDQVEVAEKSNKSLEDFVRKIMINLSNRSTNTKKRGLPNQNLGGISRSKSVYNITPSAFTIACKDSIIISGESGSGKSECYKMILHTLLEATTIIDLNIMNELKSKSILFDTDGVITLPNRMSSERIVVTRSRSASMKSRTKSIDKGFDVVDPNEVAVHGDDSDEDDKMSAYSRSSSIAQMVLSPVHTELVEKLLLSNRILESFGNSMTLHTPDSSRFAKLVELVIKPKDTANVARESMFRSMESISSQLLQRLQSGEIIAATIKTFLLETSRTSTQQKKERNFNIFYELINGWNFQERYKHSLLGKTADYYYTNQGDLPYSALLAQQDAEKFYQLNDAFLSLNFDSTAITSIYQIIGGILLVGEVNFDENLEIVLTQKFKAIDGTNGNPLHAAASLFGLQADRLKVLLTAKTLTTPNGDIIHLNLNKEQSKLARDGIVKQIYKNLFDYIVEEINAKLEEITCKMDDEDEDDDLNISRDTNDSRELKLARKMSKSGYTDLRSILILDIFGFDSFEKNSIDQLCINYANEAMQQQFNTYIFKAEIELYEQEGLHFDHLDFADNKDSLELISNGIFIVLDDQCRLPHPTDKRFLARIYKDFESHPLFAVSKLQAGRNQFTIMHFAGSVEYTVDDFIEKNLDNTPPETSKVLAGSTNPLLKNLYASIVAAEIAAQNNNANAGGPGKRGNLTGRTNTTLTVQFKNELSILLKEIESTKPHYVRCIKPTEQQWIQQHAAEHYWFSQSKVSEQLKYCGIMEGFRFTKSKISYLEFFNRYRLVAAAIFKDTFLPYFLWPAEKQADSRDEFDSIPQQHHHHKHAQKQLSPRRELSSNDEIRSYCQKLLQLFAITKDNFVKPTTNRSASTTALPKAPVTPSKIVIPSKNKQTLPPPSPYSMPAEQDNVPFVRPALKKSFSRSSTRAPFKNRLPSNYNLVTAAAGQTVKAAAGPPSKNVVQVAANLTNTAGSISNFDVDIFLAQDGIIHTKQLLLGKTKIFLPQQEHDYLEVCRSACLYHLTALIYDVYQTHKYYKLFQLTKKSVRILQKKFRNYRAKKIRLSRWRSILALQRRFRRKLFYRLIVKVQLLFRCHYSKKILRYLKEQRKELDKTYGEFMVARDMRLLRRGRLLNASMATSLTFTAEEMGNNPFLGERIAAIPTLESRQTNYHYQQDALHRAVTSINPDPNVFVSPLSLPSSKDNERGEGGSSNNTTDGDEDDDEGDEDEDTDDADDESAEILQSLGLSLKRSAKSSNQLAIPNISSAFANTSNNNRTTGAEDGRMTYQQILNYWELCLKAFPSKLSPKFYPLQCVQATNQIKSKASRYLHFVHPGKLLNAEALVHFSVIGKYMGLTVWKITTKPNENTNIPELKLTKDHVLFEFIYKIIQKLETLHETIDQAIKQNVLYLEQLQPSPSSTAADSAKDGKNTTSTLTYAQRLLFPSKQQLEEKQKKQGIPPAPVFKLIIPEKKRIIKKVRQLNQILQELSFIVNEMRGYYSHYITHFVQEYGEKSMFAQAFLSRSSQINYLLALLKIVNLEKKYDTNQLHSGYASNDSSSNAAITALTPLTIEWTKRHNELSRIQSMRGGPDSLIIASKKITPTNSVDHGENNSGKNSPPGSLRSYTTFSQRDKEMAQRLLTRLHSKGQRGTSDTLSKLAEVEHSKKLPNLDNLRIIEYNGFSYQFMPAFPAIDHAINSFSSLMLGDIPKLKQLCKLIGHRQYLGKTAYYSVSSNILASQYSSTNPTNSTISSEGGLHNNSLMDVIYDPVSLEQVESLSFSSMLITCCLFGLLNMQPNHVSVHYERKQVSVKRYGGATPPHRASTPPNGSNSVPSVMATEFVRNIKLQAVNGDEHVYSRFLNYPMNSLMNKHVHYQNLNVLFFMPHMDEPIHPALRNHFLNSSPFVAEEMMIVWLRDLYDQNQRYNALLLERKRRDGKKGPNSANRRKPEEFNEHDLEKLFIPLQLPKGSLNELYKRFKHMKKFLQDHQDHQNPFLPGSAATTTTNGNNTTTSTTSSQTNSPMKPSDEVKEKDKDNNSVTSDASTNPGREHTNHPRSDSICQQPASAGVSIPTLHGLFREFYPYLADFYHDIRSNSDFKESVSMPGVISYAYAYHHTLNKLHDKFIEQQLRKPATQQQRPFSNMRSPVTTQNKRNMASPLRATRPSPAADNQTTPPPGSTNNHGKTGISGVISNFLLRSRTNDPDDPEPVTRGAAKRSTGKKQETFNGSFWQDVTYVDGEDANEIPDDPDEQNAKRKRNILHQNNPNLNQKKIAAAPGTGGNNKKKVTIAPEPAKSTTTRQHSAGSFDYGDVYEDQSIFVAGGDNKSAYFFSAPDESNSNTSGNALVGSSARRAPPRLLSKREGSVYFNMGDVYDVNDSVIALPESLFGDEELEKKSQEKSSDRPALKTNYSSQLSYRDIYDDQSQFVMNSSTFMNLLNPNQTPSHSSSNLDLKKAASQQNPRDIMAKRKESFGFGDVYGLEEDEAVVGNMNDMENEVEEEEELPVRRPERAAVRRNEDDRFTGESPLRAAKLKATAATGAGKASTPGPAAAVAPTVGASKPQTGHTLKTSDSDVPIMENPLRARSVPRTFTPRTIEKDSPTSANLQAKSSALAIAARRGSLNFEHSQETPMQRAARVRAEDAKKTNKNTQRASLTERMMMRPEEPSIVVTRPGEGRSKSTPAARRTTPYIPLKDRNVLMHGGDGNTPQTNDGRLLTRPSIRKSKLEWIANQEEEEQMKKDNAAKNTKEQAAEVEVDPFLENPYYHPNQLNPLVVEVADFIKSFDFRSIHEISEKYSIAYSLANPPVLTIPGSASPATPPVQTSATLPSGKNIDFSLKLCKMIGKYLAFIPSMTLNNINELQLKMIFKPFLNILSGSKKNPKESAIPPLHQRHGEGQHKPPLPGKSPAAANPQDSNSNKESAFNPLKIKELNLRFDCRDDLMEIKKSAVLFYLKKDYQIEIKLICTNANANANTASNGPVVTVSPGIAATSAISTKSEASTVISPAVGFPSEPATPVSNKQQQPPQRTNKSPVKMSVMKDDRNDDVIVDFENPLARTKTNRRVSLMNSAEKTPNNTATNRNQSPNNNNLNEAPPILLINYEIDDQNQKSPGLSSFQEPKRVSSLENIDINASRALPAKPTLLRNLFPSEVGQEEKSNRSGPAAGGGEDAEDDREDENDVVVRPSTSLLHGSTLKPNIPPPLHREESFQQENQEVFECQQLKEKLMKILATCSNLLMVNPVMASPASASSSSSSTSSSLSSLQAMKQMQSNKNKIEIIKQIITYLTTPTMYKAFPIENKLLQPFENILLEFPALCMIGQLLIEKNAFLHNLLYLNKILKNKYVDRFQDFILQFIFKYPEVLILIDADGLLPCDHIKALSFTIAKASPSSSSAIITSSSAASTPRHGEHAASTSVTSGHLKYFLLTQIINYIGAHIQYRYLLLIPHRPTDHQAAGTSNNHGNSQTNHGLSSGGSNNSMTLSSSSTSSVGPGLNNLHQSPGHGIFSFYRHDEELLVLATYFDFVVSEEEITSGYFQFTKKDRYGLSILMKLLIKELYSLSPDERELSFRLFQLLIKAIQLRKRSFAVHPAFTTSSSSASLSTLQQQQQFQQRPPHHQFHSTGLEKDEELLLECISCQLNELVPLAQNIDWKYRKTISLQDSVIFHQLSELTAGNGPKRQELILDRLRSTFEMILSVSNHQ